MRENVKENKIKIRKEVLCKRNALSPKAVKEYSEIICNKLILSVEYKKATDICLYMPIHNEVDVALIFYGGIPCDKRIWLPRVLEDNMDFYSADRDTELFIGAYGIREPKSDTRLVPNENTLVVMPGAVFSKECARIGYGGGYYDKFLDKHPECMTIAVAYDFQMLDHIPTEWFDIRPKKILTEMEDYYAK